MEVGWIFFAVIAFVVIRTIKEGVARAGEELRRQQESGAGVFEELRRALEEAQRAQHRVPPPTPAPGRSSVPRRLPVPVPVSTRGEVTTSLETARENVATQDAEAEAIILRRRQSAERRNAELAGDRHAEFDRRIRRRPVAAAAAPPVLRRMPLRQAIIWREVLGAPLALRETDER